MIETRDWREAPLEPGTRLLVEASAGTGKTWTIAALYLRLLLETAAASPRRIVVATFTNKAADELRERLRARIGEALALADGDAGTRPDDPPDRAWLLARWTDPARRQEDRRRLEAALAGFDLAPIGTLHRLCERILHEEPFATGAGLGPRAVGDDAALRDELAGDLRRILLLEPDHPLARLAAAIGGPPDRATLAAGLGAVLAAGVVVADDPAWVEPALRDPALLPCLDRVLARRAALFNSRAVAADALARLAEALRAGDFTGLDVERVAEGLGKLADGTGLSKGAADDGDLAMLRERAKVLAAAVRERGRHGPWRAFWRAVAGWARAEARRRLAARGETRFDALLEAVHEALAREDGGPRPLADALHARWPWALIDEFQDTDPVQYGILDRIYADAQRAPRGVLAIVGDPKQAIYRFRGGDVATYLAAAARATARLVLATNHRSSARYVAALNALFGAGDGALSADGDDPIRYVEVGAARPPDDPDGLRVDGQPVERPLAIRRLDRPDEIDPADAEPDTATWIERALAAAADEIAALLGEARHTIGGQPVRAGQIAVLVPTNEDVRQMLAALAARRVPAVGSRPSSVFESEAARDLLVVLDALAEFREARLRAALATRLLGGGWDVARRLAADPGFLADGIERLGRWRARWLELGIGALIRTIVEAVAPRALAGPDGERVLTDLRHLGELLEDAATRHPGPHALVAWFAHQRALGTGGDETESEARRLRLESDADRVQVMTVHAAKGLEFGIVFLPLAFRQGPGRGPSKAPLARIPTPGGGFGRLDVPAAVQTEIARLEADEAFRVFYVAATRAVHRCVIYDAPPPKGRALAPLAVLLDRLVAAKGSGAAGTRADAPVTDAVRRFDITPPERAGGPAPASTTRRAQASEARPAVASAVPAWPDVPGIEWLVGLPPEAGPLPALDDGAARVAWPMPGPLPGPRSGRHSFSSLRHGRSAAEADDARASDEAEPADDELESAVFAGDASAADDAADPEIAALATLRGTRFGDAVHAILEHRAPGQSLAAQPELVRRALGALGAAAAAPTIVEALARRLDQMLGMPLWPGTPALGALPASEWRAEFDFALDLPRLDLVALRRVAAARGEPDLVPASDRVVAGLLRGQIDLVLRIAGRYHALDWKTNWLGPRRADYEGAALDRAMDRPHYRFQALLYTLALDRHLRARLPGYRREARLGDPVYVFVRAAGLAPGLGVWSKPFDPRLLDAIDALLDGRAPDREAA
jgi:exodeoxyribonuclease V beta subunit